MNNIKVGVKLRPLIQREIDANRGVRCTARDASIVCHYRDLRRNSEQFYFDHVFNIKKTNSDIFDAMGKPIVDAVLNGINGTIFTYGPPGSGKTFIMTGEDKDPGVMFRSIDYMFEKMTASSNERKFVLRASYFEIYNGRFIDLLDETRGGLPIRGESTGPLTVSCKEEYVDSAEALHGVLREGMKNRKMAETRFNARASRSHVICRIMMESFKAKSDGAVRTAQLNLIDIGGSEKPGPRGPNAQRSLEDRHLTMSIYALNEVVTKLVVTNSGNMPNSFVNYRASKLTRVLETSLGGNTTTAIICAATPAEPDETRDTLIFALRAKRIRNKPRVNERAFDTAFVERYARQTEETTEKLKETLTKVTLQLEEKDRYCQQLEKDFAQLSSSVETTRVASANAAVGRGRSNKSRSPRRRSW